MGDVIIRGDGVAAYCCAHLLKAAGFRVSLDQTERRRLPAIMLGEAALALIREVFEREDLFRDLPRIERRVVAWGPKNALQAAFLAHMLMCGLLLLFGLLCGFKIAYLVGWFIIVGCLVLEHWIARRRSLNWVQTAFFRLNAVVSSIFLIVTLAEVVFRGGFRVR